MKNIPNEIYEKGKNLIIQEKFDDALDYFNDLHNKEKENAIYSNYIGIIYFLKEDYKKAADFFKKAIELDPNNWFSYHKLGQICTIKKIDTCAIKYFTETIDRNPKNINALINLAIIFQKENEDLAMELITSALTVEPLNLVANYLLGALYLKQKKYKKAENLLEKVVSENPSFLMGWYKLGLLYFSRNKMKKAIDSINNALRINEKPYLYNLLGLIFLRNFKLEEAANSFKEAIKLDPKDPSPWINLADAYFKGQKIESAKLCLKEALLVAKKNIHKLAIWINLANCYEQENILSNCLYCLNKAHDSGIEDVEESLEDFDIAESQMEFLHDISLKINDLRNRGITPKRPIDLSEKNDSNKSK
ncbi:MAG: tetratricopeptide repeat protein [Promethearchaeota archaeon]